MDDISDTIKRDSKMTDQVACLKTQEVKATTIKAKCPDCDADLDVPKDTAQGEILSCPGCGLELEVKQVTGGCIDLQELTIEGEDWGE